MTVGYYTLDSKEMQKALDEKQFTLSLQPIINVERESFETLEVFIRWKHPILGMLPPSLFMGRMAKENMQSQMTDYIIKEATKICMTSRVAGKIMGVNININFNELTNPETLASLEKATAYMDDPENVCFELSPTILTKFSETISSDNYYPDMFPSEEEMEYLMSLKKILEGYSKLGITLALDTYDHILGAIDRAKILGLHALKISPKLIAMATTEGSDYLEKCHAKATEAGIALIATGVENMNLMKSVVMSGINYVQGLFMCPPVYEDQLNKWNHGNLIEVKRIIYLLKGGNMPLRTTEKMLLQEANILSKESNLVIPMASFSLASQSNQIEEETASEPYYAIEDVKAQMHESKITKEGVPSKAEAESAKKASFAASRMSVAPKSFGKKFGK